MKRIKFIAMIAVLSIGLVGCGNAETKNNATNSNIEQSSTQSNSVNNNTTNNSANQSTNNVNNSTNISVEKAKEIALNHAGLSSNQVTFVRTERDFDNGIEKYEVEFYNDGMEYDYEINASNGEIISYDNDADYYNPNNQSNTNNSANISADKAKEIALKHANLSADNVNFARVELDYDNGIKKYDVEFYANNREYSYEINANTGDILSYEQD